MKKLEEGAIRDMEKAEKDVAKSEQELRNAQRNLSKFMEEGNASAYLTRHRQGRHDDCASDDDSDTDDSDTDDSDADDSDADSVAIANEPLTFNKNVSMYKGKSSNCSIGDCSHESGSNYSDDHIFEGAEL